MLLLLNVHPADNDVFVLLQIASPQLSNIFQLVSSYL